MEIKIGPLVNHSRGHSLFMIKIGINKKLDYVTYENFRDFSAGGVDFGAKIKKDHPKINQKNYKKYIDEFYKKNRQKLLRIQKKSDKYITKKQNDFWNAVKNISDFSDKKDPYMGYLSIFDCNPRFLGTKTFQIYCKRNLPEMAGVAFHESLHFIFFDYINKNLKKIRKFDKNSGPLWELSEIFNMIILNLPEFRKITRRKEKLFYPELKWKLAKVKKIWKETKGNLKNFILQGLDILQYS